MYSASLLLSSLFALTATATPFKHSHMHTHNHIVERDETFAIEVTNNCPSTKHFGMYQITSAFAMVSKCEPLAIETNCTETFNAPYKDLGLRLSGHAEWGTAGQWAAQALVEFGYSEYDGTEGTAYNLSLMEGCEDDVGVAVYPQNTSSDCASKKCYPDDCPLSQGWTNPDQTSSGSLADTVCYHGKVDFKVVFCP